MADLGTNFLHTNFNIFFYRGYRINKFSVQYITAKHITSFYMLGRIVPGTSLEEKYSNTAKKKVRQNKRKIHLP